MLKLMPTSALNAGFILAAVTAPIIDHASAERIYMIYPKIL